MIVEIDLTTVPPAVTLLDADDFNSFKVVARGDKAYVEAATIAALAAERGQDPLGLDRLASMTAFLLAVPVRWP